MAAGSILRRWLGRAGAFVALAFFVLSADAQTRFYRVTAVNPNVSCVVGQILPENGTCLAPYLSRSQDAANCGSAPYGPGPNARWGAEVQVYGPPGGAYYFTQQLFSTGTANFGNCANAQTSQSISCPPGQSARWTGTALSCVAAETECPVAGSSVEGASFNVLAGGSGVITRPGGLRCQIQGRGACVQVGEAGPYVCGEAVYTGAVASASEEPRGSSGGCVTSAAGKTLCVSNRSNCGTVNGEEICLGTAPRPGGCVTTAGGNTFCTTNASNPASAVLPRNADNSPRPIDAQIIQGPAGQAVVGTGTGSAGTAGATSTGAVVLVGAPTITPTTGDASGGATGGSTGGAIGGGTGGGTGGTTGGGTGGTTGGVCGLPGGPLCRVGLDETDVPTTAPEGLFPDGTAEAQAKAQATAANMAQSEGAAADQTAATSGLWSMLEGMVGSSSGECATVPYGFTAPPPFNVSVRGNFPEENGCQLFGVLRVIFSYALAGLTLLSCFRRVRQAFFSAPV